MNSIFIVILTSLLMTVSGCGDSRSEKKVAGPVQPEASGFSRDIDPILQRNCGGCHSTGAKHSVFVGDEAAFKTAAAAMIERITSDNPKFVMPPMRAREPLTEAERETLLAYLRS